ncbi:hypothetical protein ACHAXR_011845 [Thalassiosira sp. AJA248-18]
MNSSSGFDYVRSRYNGDNQQENIAAAASSIGWHLSTRGHYHAPIGLDFFNAPPHNGENLLQASQMGDGLLNSNESSAKMRQQLLLQYQYDMMPEHQYPPLPHNSLPLTSGPSNANRTARESMLFAGGGPITSHQYQRYNEEVLAHLMTMGLTTTHSLGPHITAPAPSDDSCYSSQLSRDGSQTARGRLLFAGAPIPSPSYQSIGFDEEDLAALTATRHWNVGTHVTIPVAAHSSYPPRLSSRGSRTAHGSILLTAEQTPLDQSTGLNAEDLDHLPAIGSHTTRSFGPHVTAPTPADNNYPSILAAGSAVASSIDQDQRKEPGTTHPTSLFIESDCSFLGPLHSFLRHKCIEVFASTKEDMTPQGREARPSKIGQVGLRCCYCKGAPKEKFAKQAVCYPSKRATIFDSIRNFQRFHMTCTYMPEKTKAEYKCLTDQEYILPKRPQKYMKAYYAEAASELGIVDTPNGLVFGAPPNKSVLQSLIQAAESPTTSSLFWKTYSSVNSKANPLRKFEQVASDSTKRVINNARKKPTPFVYPEDFPTVSDFDFILFHQVIPCTPSIAILEQKRLYSYGDKTTGLIGFRCKHCACTSERANHKDKGTFFPADLNSLAESSFLQRMSNHFMNCPCVPQEVKDAFDELKQLASEHGAAATKRGPRKRFIKKIYERMDIYSGLKYRDL